MARRSSFSQQMAQYQREVERQAKARDQAERRAAREAERARKEYERAVATEEKERKRLYLESRVAEVDAKNEELDLYVTSLDGILAATLDVDVGSARRETETRAGNGSSTRGVRGRRRRAR